MAGLIKTGILFLDAILARINKSNLPELKFSVVLRICNLLAIYPDFLRTVSAYSSR